MFCIISWIAKLQSTTIAKKLSLKDNNNSKNILCTSTSANSYQSVLGRTFKNAACTTNAKTF